MLELVRFIGSLLLELVPMIRTQEWAFRSFFSVTGDEILHPINVVCVLTPEELNQPDIEIHKARSFDWLFMSFFCGLIEESSNG